MLAANSDLQLGPHSAPVLDSDSDEATNASRIQNLKRIVRKDTTFEVRRKKPASVVPTQTERGLRKIVCPKREKLRGAGNLVRR